MSTVVKKLGIWAFRLSSRRDSQQTEKGGKEVLTSARAEDLAKREKETLRDLVFM